MTRMQDIQIVVGVDQSGGFAKEGKIPWNHPGDLKHFKKLTSDGVCIMGKHTYADIINMRNLTDMTQELLPNRQSIVLTTNESFIPLYKTTKAKSLRFAVEHIALNNKPIFVIGGERLFWQSISLARQVHLTLIMEQHNCDKFFPVDYLRRNFRIGKVTPISDNIKCITYQR